MPDDEKKMQIPAPLPPKEEARPIETLSVAINSQNKPGTGSFVAYCKTKKSVVAAKVEGPKKKE